jgi:3-dehydroquinate dehydratase I
MKICACLAEQSFKDCINKIKKINTLPIKIIEHRIDFMKNIEKLEEIYSQTKLPIIATCKIENNFKGNEKDIYNVLINAINAGCSFVDIDLNMNEEIREKIILQAKKRKIKVIISWHDFKKTPLEKELKDILTKEIKAGADICKIVTTSKSENDNNIILSLYDEIKQVNFTNVKLIAFAMGTKGKITRINALKKGCPFMYASINKKSAPGQIDVKEMCELLK